MTQAHEIFDVMEFVDGPDPGQTRLTVSSTRWPGLSLRLT